MKAEETVLTCRTNCPDINSELCMDCTYGIAYEEGCEDQAEISFKAGEKDFEGRCLAAFYDGRKRGMREVVEWMRVASVVKHHEYTDDNGKKWRGVSFCITPKQWQDQLKKWDINV